MKTSFGLSSTILFLGLSFSGYASNEIPVVCDYGLSPITKAGTTRCENVKSLLVDLDIQSTLKKTMVDKIKIKIERASNLLQISGRPNRLTTLIVSEYLDENISDKEYINYLVEEKIQELKDNPREASLGVNYFECEDNGISKEVCSTQIERLKKLRKELQLELPDLNSISMIENWNDNSILTMDSSSLYLNINESNDIWHITLLTLDFGSKIEKIVDEAEIAMEENPKKEKEILSEMKAKTQALKKSLKEDIVSICSVSKETNCKSDDFIEILKALEY